MLVTGASSGIRAACARAFAAEGACVLVHFNRGEDRAREIADDLGGMPAAQADLTVEADADQLFEEARAALGSVVWALSPERWEATLRAHRTATFPTARGFLREVERITKAMPLRKVATPEDVAAQVVVLASDALSGHVTSQVVVVAGGMESRLVHAEQEST